MFKSHKTDRLAASYTINYVSNLIAEFNDEGERTGTPGVWRRRQDFVGTPILEGVLQPRLSADFGRLLPTHTPATE